MSEAVTCEQAQESLGVLVLGAIDPVERASVERHALSCPTCAGILAEISPMPGLLRRVDLRADVDIPPQAVLDRALLQIRSEARARTRPASKWGRITLGAVAAIVVLVLGFAVVRNSMSSPASVTVTAASPVPSPVPNGPASATNRDTGVTATISLTSAAVGTKLDVSVSGVKAGEHCEIVVVSRDGSREVAASWMAGYVGAAEVTGTTSIAADDVSRIEISTPDGRELVTVPINEA